MANNSKPKTNGNDPVGTFPTEMHPGLTKREYFAAIALSGLFADERVNGENGPVYAVKAADALIEELNK